MGTVTAPDLDRDELRRQCERTARSLTAPRTILNADTVLALLDAQDAEIADTAHKARLFDEMAQGVLSDFPDIIRSEWNTQTPGGGLPGCVEGALRERARLLDEIATLRRLLEWHLSTTRDATRHDPCDDATEGDYRQFCRQCGQDWPCPTEEAWRLLHGEGS